MTAADSDGPGRRLLRTGPNAKQFPQPTIFDSLQESGHDWMMIYNDSKHETYVESLTTPNAAEHTYNMDEFFHRAEHGTLPALTWIGPREGTNASLGDLGSERQAHPPSAALLTRMVAAVGQTPTRTTHPAATLPSASACARTFTKRCAAGRGGTRLPSSSPGTIPADSVKGRCFLDLVAHLADSKHE